MSIEVLEKFAIESGNEAVVNAVNGIKETYKSNLDRVRFLESDLQKSIEKRDSIKNIVRSKLGVDEVSEDSIESVLSKLKGGSDENSKAELDNMAKVVESLKAEKESLLNKHTQTVNGYKLEKQLASLGAFEETENARAYDILFSAINENVSYEENGDIIFKKDGLTLRNSDGSPVSLSDMYKSIKDSEEYSFLFKTRRTKSGSGANPSSNGGASIKKASEYTEAERIALFKADPARFRELFKK